MWDLVLYDETEAQSDSSTCSKSQRELVSRVTRNRTGGHTLLYSLTPSECLRIKGHTGLPNVQLWNFQRLGVPWCSLWWAYWTLRNNFQLNSLLIKQSQSSWWRDRVSDHNQLNTTFMISWMQPTFDPIAIIATTASPRGAVSPLLF